ncbi:RagB/SusD family nutrient uptake outer membrane protein [Telluribacter sp. SYSU D00476]|uniref:RagB/SusD family nutrient uptake outer membrane protein n=1 Tax=Telluribacter sp. SYSU D00476 TaxID=2811430 RepID=UPI001FF1A1E8|nr:RagB/SusD family nutrient uptake outer membrane protein [Telluribacter sp. SYSU D00476]
MKKLSTLLFVSFLTLMGTSCSEDFLDHTPPGNLTDQTFYNSPDAAFKSLVTCYRGFYNFWGYEAARAELGNMATDDSDKGGSDAGDRPFVTDLGYGRALSSNETLSGYWAACYAAIGNCNVALERLPEANLIDASGAPLSDNLRNRYLAEIRFLRAMFYFELTKVFGGVPLITTTLTVDDRTKLNRATSREVFEFVEKELLAVANDPDMLSATSMQPAELGRATKEAAWALLARTYLFFAKDDTALFAKARDAAKKVIDSNAFALHPEYQEIFLEHGYKTKEAVFSIIMGDVPAVPIYGSTTPVYTSPRGATGGWGFDMPTQDLVNEFEEGDPRLLFTIIEEGDVFPRLNGTTEVLDFSTYANTGYHNRKSYLPESRRGQGWGNDAWTYHPIRYADVLLMYAEALIESGGSKEEAASYINMVRQRAANSTPKDVEAVSRVLKVADKELPDVKPTDDLRKAVRHERRVELAMEYHRLFDLIRWNTLVETMNAFSKLPFSNGKGANFTKGKSEVFPVPQVEIDRSGGSIAQNPNY